MKALFRFIVVLVVVGLVAALVASIVSKKKLASMSDDEIREYLGLKLSGRVGDDQLVTIQDAVISGVRGKQPTVDHYIDEVEDALEDLEDVATDVAEDVTDAAEDVKEEIAAS